MTILCTPKAELRIEREQAVDRLIRAYEANNIPCPEEAISLFVRIPLHTLLENADHWENAAKDAEEAYQAAITRLHAEAAGRPPQVAADCGRAFQRSLHLYHGDYLKD